MRIEQLELLVVLADTGSLRRAAQRMNVSQPALTRSLKLLEASFGAPLVNRSTRGMRLTSAGERLAARARSISQELRRARDEVAALAGRWGGTVCIGASTAMMMQAVPDAVALFRTRCPEVRLRLVDTLYPTAFARLRAGELDFVVGPVPPEGADPDLRTEPIAVNALRVVARAAHPRAAARSVAELADAGWALVGPRGGPGDLSRLPFAELGVPVPEPVVECESLGSFIEVAPRLDVMGLLPVPLLARAEAIGLRALSLAEPITPVAIHLVRRADALLTPAAERLADCIRSVAARAPRQTPSPAQGPIGR